MKRRRGATPRRTASTLANREAVAKNTHLPFQPVALANIEHFAQEEGPTTGPNTAPET